MERVGAGANGVGKERPLVVPDPRLPGGQEGLVSHDEDRQGPTAETSSPCREQRGPESQAEEVRGMEQESVRHALGHGDDQPGDEKPGAERRQRERQGAPPKVAPGNPPDHGQNRDARQGQQRKMGREKDLGISPSAAEPDGDDDEMCVPPQRFQSKGHGLPKVGSHQDVIGFMVRKLFGWS